MRIYENITELIGNTPMLYLNKLGKDLPCKIAAKLEFENPGHSVKDRAALSMVLEAEKNGQLHSGMTILEPTSGNMGISLAMIAAVRGYKCLIIMPESMSLERRAIMKAYGAELILTPERQGMSGSIAEARRLLSIYPNQYFMPMQFENPANPDAHRSSTAQEILRDTDGKVDMVIAGVGTGGTITGIGEALKEIKPELEIIAVEPAGSPVLSGGSPGSHGIMGIGAGFVPSILNTSIYNEVIAVGDEDAYLMARRAAKEEGLLVGISSGAVIYGAFALASRPQNRGKLIVGILASSGERYLSTPLFSDSKA
ncbi:MAG: Cysteine synthase [Spirochaetes bacterium ADurb.Bin110]|mgnify:FL=1|nr:MAG: Cysteine synthase [Spirochaetes bacterium ADurb.Bin110]